MTLKPETTHETLGLYLAHPNQTGSQTCGHSQSLALFLTPYRHVYAVKQ